MYVNGRCHTRPHMTRCKSSGLCCRTSFACLSDQHLTHWGRDKWLPIGRRHFRCIFLERNCLRMSIKISLKFVPKGLISNFPALVEIMAWRRPGDKPLSEPMVVRLSRCMCVTRPQWVKTKSDNLSCLCTIKQSLGWQSREVIPVGLND